MRHLFSNVQLFAILWTVTCEAPLLPPPPRDLPDPGIERVYPALQVDSLNPDPPGKPYPNLSFTLIKEVRKGFLMFSWLGLLLEILESCSRLV